MDTMVPPRLITYRRIVIIALHLALIPLGYFLAFALRFDFALPERYAALLWPTLPYLLAVRLGVFAVYRLYHGWWRHVGMHDLVNILKAVTVSSALFAGVLYVIGSLDQLPRSVLFLDWVTAFFIFGGIRFAVRGLREGHVVRVGESGRHTLILGAGEAAERLLRQLRRGNGDLALCPIALVDDDPSKMGMRLHGVPVLGTSADLQELVSRHRIEMLVIAIPSATREQMQTIVERCMETGVEFKIVPALQELLDGRARLSQLRKVQVEDLLGRDAVELSLTEVRGDITGKVVLVTGGAGSIGSELARQISGLRPRKLILLDQAESPLYFTHLEIVQAHPDLELVPVVGDVAHRSRLESVFAAHRPDYVFHAAAYKHVPLMEANVVEAVRNNVLGTLMTAQFAAQYGAEKFVLISTDKAVHPSSVMGATKRIAERVVLGWPSLRESGTDFRAVRFGNVLGSDGSVVPLFRRQLAAGGPLTVTHRDVTRYFMTIPEAVQLVLQAASLPEAAGRISMLEMGAPVRIVELAENLIRLSGLDPYKEIPIVFTGLRPGEKLHEELMSAMEATVPTRMDKIRIVQTDETDGKALERGVDRVAAAVEVNDPADLRLAICALVPDCVAPLREIVAPRAGTPQPSWSE